MVQENVAFFGRNFSNVPWRPQSNSVRQNSKLNHNRKVS